MCQYQIWLITYFNKNFSFISTIVICTYIYHISTVNVPRVNVTTNSTPTLNEPLTVQCYATTTTFVDTRVDIVWDLTDDDDDEMVFRTIERATGTLSTDGSRLEFRDSFTIAMLNESYNDDMYKCVVTIFAGTKRISEMADVSLEDLGIFGKHWNVHITVVSVN